MIFNRIILKNVFAYQFADIKLDGAKKGKNIVLIQGRNNFGKTSIINAVKLLFVGPNREMCLSVQQGRELKPKQYVQGLGEDWMGILNRRAKRAGKTNCSVKIFWEEEGFEAVEATRSWRIRESSFDEKLEVDLEGERQIHIEGEDAQKFLNERLPEDFLPFFFFDGEQIQRIAEANRSYQQQQIERLLNITPIDTLVDYLESLAKEWNKQSMEAAEKAKLTELQNELEMLDARFKAEEEKKQSISKEKESLELRIQEEEKYLESRRMANLAQEERHLTAEKEGIENQLERSQISIGETLPGTAPLLANPKLVERALEEVLRLVENETAVQAEALSSVLTNLPNELFDRPPHPSPKLTENQVLFYKKRLSNWLQAYIPGPEAIGDGLFHLEQYRARKLESILDFFSGAGQERRNKAMELREISRLKRRLGDINKSIEDLSNLSQDEQEEYAKRKSENTEREQRVGMIKGEIKFIEKDQSRIREGMEDTARKIRFQEKKVHATGVNRLRLNQTQQTIDFFREYKKSLKAKKRDVVEKNLNRRFRHLVGRSELIRHIQVDEQFGIHFLGQDDDVIGMASLSAGMKQLVATALLWSLKDVSAKDVPLIIDTPLARIDLENQQRLIRDYYPTVGTQVIVLATNSEINAEKYQMLSPHVYREFRLENSLGDDARIVETELYPNNN